MTQLLTILARLPARWLSLILLTIYLFTYAGVTHSVDEIAALTVTESLLVEQRWHTNQMAWDQTRTPPQNAPGVDGNLFSKKGLGVSLLALPFFALKKLWPTVGAVQLALLAGGFLTAATGYFFYHLIRTLRFPPTTAALGTLVLGLATPLWPYARTLFSESLAAFGLCVALFGAFYYRQAERQSTQLAALFASSCGLAILILARSANGILVVPILVYIGYSGWSKQDKARPFLLRYRELFALGLPLGGALLLTVLYNDARFHTWLTFPQAAFETFSTPLLTGLTGLLVSPGKGLLWYMPVVVFMFVGLPEWRKLGWLPEYALAATLVVLTLLLYAKWYDWTGGRAWGPRLLVMSIPALLVLCLPIIDRLRQPQGYLRWWIGGVLLLSFLVQLPGALWNFEWVEAEQMQDGISFAQLVWSPAHTPLLTTWTDFASRYWLDPVWWQAAFWQQPWPQRSAFSLVALLLLGLLGWGLCRVYREQATTWLWVAGVGCALLLAGVTVRAAATDPRLAERTANPADNQAVVNYITAERQPGDVVLLDMTAATDQQGRQRFWMNNGGSQVPYIAWVRNSAALSLDEQLAGWLQPYSRIWLVMQETVENAPDSTTEQWLDQHAYRGRQQWLGSQRLVEYLAAATHEPLAVLSTPVAFGEATVLKSYQLQHGRASTYALLALQWQVKPAAVWRFSVQALNESGQVVAQVDGTPARLAGQRDQLGLVLSPSMKQLILKVYNSQNSQVALVTRGNTTSDYLVLYAFP